MSKITEKDFVSTVENGTTTKHQWVGDGFHPIVRGIFIFFIITSAFSSISKLVTNLAFGNTFLGLFMFLCEAACCFFIYVMLQKKAWGLYALFGMLLLQIPLNLILGNQNMESVYISVFIRLAIFSLLLLVPKDKVTGWKLLFNKQEKADDIHDNEAIVESENPAPHNAFTDTPLATEKEVTPTEEEPNISVDESITPKGADKEQTIVKEQVVFASSENKQVVLPVWAFISIIALLLIIIMLLAIKVFSGSATESKFRSQSKIEGILSKKQLDYPSASIDSTEDKYSKEELEKRRKNIARIYEIYIEEHYTQFADNIEDFTSQLSQKTVRRKVYAQLDKDYKMDDFESFEKKIYPATREHLDKERNRQWLYEHLQNAGLVVGSYDTFTTLICEDKNLEYYYREGNKSGLNLGSFEELVKHIK